MRLLEFSGETRDRALWSGLSLVESALRRGHSDGVLQRLLREAVEKDPSLDAYHAWLAGEFRRGDIPRILDAGRALQGFDARPYVRGIRQPAAVVLTTEDRLVPPLKQRALAESLGATTFEIAGDHDAAITCGDAFAAALRAAVDDVSGREVRSRRSRGRSTLGGRS